MKRAVLAFAALLAFAGAMPAVAGTFCVTGMAIPPQCYYEDVQACQRAASPPNTYCDISPDARLMYYGDAKYCAVRSDRLAQCMYVDREQCYDDASKMQGICIDRDQVVDDPSPFRYDQRIQR